jgi:hypothetical protein
VGSNVVVVGSGGDVPVLDSWSGRNAPERDEGGCDGPVSAAGTTTASCWPGKPSTTCSVDELAVVWMRASSLATRRAFCFRLMSLSRSLRLATASAVIAAGFCMAAQFSETLRACSALIPRNGPARQERVSFGLNPPAPAVVRTGVVQ